MAEEQVQAQEQVEETTEQGTVEPEVNQDVTHEKPSHVPDKFWNAESGEVMVDDVLKSYTEMEKYVGSQKEQMKDEFLKELEEQAIGETPETYTMPKLPEGITEEMVNDNPMSEWWAEHCKANHYNQEEYEEGVNKYMDLMMSTQPNLDEELSKLGENGKDRIEAVNNWASNYFTPQDFETIQYTLGSTADGVEVLEKIMNNINQTNFNRSQQVAQPDKQLTLDDVRSMMKDKRYFDPRHRDDGFVKKVDEAFQRLYRG
jgi:hypothetical protein